MLHLKYVTCCTHTIKYFFIGLCQLKVDTLERKQGNKNLRP